MKRGMADAFITGRVAASLHREDYKDFIEDERSFSSRTRFHAFKEQQHRQFVDDMKKKQKLLPVDHKKVEQLVTMINDSSHTLSGFWKTSTTSRLCAVVFRATNNNNKDAWAWDPKLFTNVFNNINSAMDLREPLLNEAFSNMEFGEASCPEGSDKKKPWVVSFTPRDDPSRIINLTKYRCYTFITIPDEDLLSENKKAEWCASAVEKILKGIRNTVKTPVFHQHLHKTWGSRYQKYIKKMFNASKSSSLPKSMESADILATPVHFLTDLVIQRVSNRIMSNLWDHNSEHLAE